MASSPPAYSPPQQPHLSLPRKRPSIQLPPVPIKRRKQSIASAASHPLRQTSFPPPDSQNAPAVYSPGSERSDSLDIDDEYSSVVGSTAGADIKGSGKKTERVKKEKRGRVGRPPKNAPRGDTASLIDGETSTVVSGRKAGGTSAYGAQNANDEDEDGSEDDDGGAGDDAGIQGGKLTKAQIDAEKERRAKFVGALSAEHAERYEMWNRIHLKKDIVRKLTNQTLSQSVPASVVTTINAYTKVFVGEIVDRAREVQKEWMAASEKLPTGEKNEQGDAEGEAKVAERDLGPLMPDHLREALRRYKTEQDGGTVGFTGLSLEGRERAAVRNGGKRLFK